MRPHLSRLALFISLLSARAVAALEVPLTIVETAGVARQAAPASASVPLPRGRLADPEAIWLAGADGRPTLAQGRALERWRDGSVRWLLLDFLADVPAGQVVTYTLHDGRAPRPISGRRLRTVTREGTRVIDTGRLHATIGGEGADVLLELLAGARPVRVPPPELALAGASSVHGSVERVTDETLGPVRTEVLVTGRYAPGIAFEARLALFAGQPLVRIQHTILNLTDPDYLRVRSLAFVVPGHFSAGQIGVDGGSRALATLDTGHELRQLDVAPAHLDGVAVGRHGDGWVRAGGDKTAVTVTSRYFWQEYPQAIRIAPDGVRLDLLAGGDDPIAVGRGAAKTHELWIALEDVPGATSGGDLPAALRAPLVALPAANWVVASGALPNALAPAAPGARDFLTRLSQAYDRYEKRVRTERWDDGPPLPCEERRAEHPRVGFYGALNWGDWNFPGYRDHSEGCDGWGNLEYDLPEVLGLAWAATGASQFLEGFTVAARHYRDVDVIHHAPQHPDWVGLNHPHKALHFAPESKSTVDLGHTWTEGLLTHYRLTGEVRSLAAARGIADALVPRLGKAGNPRQFGWPMIALTAVYDATHERRYLDAARAYGAAAMSAYRATPGAGDWKMGILADGLARLYALTGDDRLRRWLVAYADALLPDDRRFRDFRYALPLGELAARTGDRRYEARALEVAAALEIGNWGKPLAAAGRTGFRLLGPLAAPHPPVVPPRRPDAGRP